MNDNLGGPGNLLDTTDCLEAVGVFKGWKNFMFIITILCLLLLQGAFWLVRLGLVRTGQEPADEAPVAAVSSDVNMPADVNDAAATDPNDPNATTAMQPAEPKPARKSFLPFEITFDHVSWAVRFVNAVAALAAIIYCLTTLFSLKVSLMGRLGGINHISRAFFISLLMVVFLLPWQIVFGPGLPGAIYLPAELAQACSAKPGGIFEQVLFYLRFSGYWLLVVLLLILAQLRSSRWTGAILRRLEVI
ncbi:MAG: hypothetical protein JSU94_00410 [Phycisphaerales bacterium]|nr:MAG: hypothetical protein JSU94_00410 [Phycisphaerales bacterium]